MLRLNDLDPDGVNIIIDWGKMVVGASVFIPCINTQKATTQCKNIFKRKCWQLEIRVIIQDNKLGVRIWRIL